MIKKLYNYIRPLKIPAEVKNTKGKILLHIGDVPVRGYPYIKRLVREVMPDELLTSNANQKPRPEVVKK